MRRLLFQSLSQPAGHGSAARARRERNRRTRGARRHRRTAPTRAQSVDPRSRRGFVQWLRTGNSRAQQRDLRPRTFRPSLRRVAATRRRIARHRTADVEHARSAAAYVRCNTGAEVGRRRRRLCDQRRSVCGQLCGGKRHRRCGTRRSHDRGLSAVAGAVADRTVDAARSIVARISLREMNVLAPRRSGSR